MQLSFDWKNMHFPHFYKNAREQKQKTYNMNSLLNTPTQPHFNSLVRRIADKTEGSGALKSKEIPTNQQLRPHQICTLAWLLPQTLKP